MTNTTSSKKLFLITLSVPLLILVSLTVKPLWTLAFGEEITLRTMPIDPKNLFYGDYVDLHYEIEDVPLDKIADDLRAKIDGNLSNRPIRVYGILIQEDDGFTLKSLTHKKPRNGTYLTGTLQYYPFYSDYETESLTVDFNLERFFVPENTGMAFEDLARRGELIAHIKLKNGYAVLRDLRPTKKRQ